MKMKAKAKKKADWKWELVDRILARGKEQGFDLERFKTAVRFERFACATDGHVFFAFEGEELPQVEAQGVKNIGPMILNYEAGTRGKVQVEGFRSWCNKRSKSDLESPCSPGVIFDVVVDRRILSMVLRGVPDKEISVGSRGPMEPMYFEGEGWRCVVMPMRKERFDVDGLPEFEVE